MSKKKIKENMKTLKTFEEFNWSKRKELTPEEKYRKQEEEARKEREKIVDKEKEFLPYAELFDNEDEWAPSPAVRTSTVGKYKKIKTEDAPRAKNQANDPWGEEDWE